MKEKRKLLYVLVSILVLITAWGYFFYFPMKLSIVRAESESKLLETKIKSSSAFRSKIPLLKKQQHKLEQELTEAENKILRAASTDTMISLLKRRLDAYDIKIHRVNPVLSQLSDEEKVKTTDNYQSLIIEINLETTFFNLTGFLDDINDFSFFINPRGLTIEKNENAEERLTINLLAEIYVKTGNE